MAAVYPVGNVPNDTHTVSISLRGTSPYIHHNHTINTPKPANDWIEKEKCDNWIFIFQDGGVQTEWLDLTAISPFSLWVPITPYFSISILLVHILRTFESFFLFRCSSFWIYQFNSFLWANKFVRVCWLMNSFVSTKVPLNTAFVNLTATSQSNTTIDFFAREGSLPQISGQYVPLLIVFGILSHSFSLFQLNHSSETMQKVITYWLLLFLLLGTGTLLSLSMKPLKIRISLSSLNVRFITAHYSSHPSDLLFHTHTHTHTHNHTITHTQSHNHTHTLSTECNASLNEEGPTCSNPIIDITHLAPSSVFKFFPPSNSWTYFKYISKFTFPLCYTLEWFTFWIVMFFVLVNNSTSPSLWLTVAPLNPANTTSDSFQVTTTFSFSVRTWRFFFHFYNSPSLSHNSVIFIIHLLTDSFWNGHTHSSVTLVHSFHKLSKLVSFFNCWGVRSLRSGSYIESEWFCGLFWTILSSKYCTSSCNKVCTGSMVHWSIDFHQCDCTFRNLDRV
jgi:hypothetical protein